MTSIITTFPFCPSDTNAHCSVKLESLCSWLNSSGNPFKHVLTVCLIKDLQLMKHLLEFHTDLKYTGQIVPHK